MKKTEVIKGVGRIPLLISLLNSNARTLGRAIIIIDNIFIYFFAVWLSSFFFFLFVCVCLCNAFSSGVTIIYFHYYCSPFSI